MGKGVADEGSVRSFEGLWALVGRVDLARCLIICEYEIGNRVAAGAKVFLIMYVCTLASLRSGLAPNKRKTLEITVLDA